MQPIIALLILLGVFNSLSKAVKKRNQASGAEKKATPVPPHIARRVMKQIDPSVWDKIDRAAASHAEKQKAAPAWKSGEGDDPCHEEMLSGVKPRGHEEGADPCHEYMLFDSPGEENPSSPAEDTQQAQELLRGVILSEILKRPRSVYSRR